MAGNSEWAQVKAPRVRPGPYRLVLRGQSSGSRLERNVTVKPLSPTIELSPWAGPPGTLLQVNARGFAPGESVRIYLGEDPLEAASPIADPWGNFWSAGPMRVPYGAAGKLMVTAMGSESVAMIHVDFKVLEPKPWLELTNWWGPPGASVGFSGGGWAPGETINVHVGDVTSPVVATAKADDYGWLRGSTATKVPRDAIADVAFAAVGQESRTFATAVFKLVFPLGLKPGGDLGLKPAGDVRTPQGSIQATPRPIQAGARG
jgi:hypothetical protein